MNTIIPFWQRQQVRIVALSVIALMLLLAYWGGFPSHVGIGTLALGLFFLVAVVMFFGFLVYYFYFAPLPEKEQRSLKVATPSSNVRQIVATVTFIATTLISIGLFWDELWHRLYGVGAVVNDFFWRPHILLYVGMGINALFALGGMFLITQRGKGTLRQRFRAEPFLGLLTLAAGFQMMTAPLDPMWHQIFGIDITAWSLPHLLLGTGLLAVMLVGSSIQFSLVQTQSWRIWKGFSINEALTYIVLAFATTVLLQFGTTEWENIDAYMPKSYAVFQRPEWLYPVVLITVSLFIGMIAIHLTKRIGAATLVFGLTLVLRLVLLSVFNATAVANMTYKANLLIIAPLVALDLWYAFRLRTGSIDAPNTRLGGSLVLALATFFVTLPLISQMLYYPHLSPPVIIGAVVFGIAMAIVTGWVGAWLGTWLRSLGHSTTESETVPQATYRRTLSIGLASLVVMLVFVAIFIVTATPPVA